jgi:LacI family transcriptional regulator
MGEETELSERAPADGSASRSAARSGQSTSTLVAVAQTAGVDASTVSRVLRNDPVVRVRPATRERIIAAAAALGYVPNVNARSLVLRRTMTIGLIIPSASNVVYDQIIKGAESAARAAGYVLLLTESSDFGEVEAAYRELVLGGRVDGLLIGSGNLNDSLPDVVFERSGNCVVLNRLIRGPIPSVIEDDERGMSVAVARLVELGHTRIACLAGPVDVDTATRRLAGYKEAMREARLSVGPRYVERAAFSEAGGYEAMRRLLGAPDPPTAVAVSSVIAAVGALAACHDAQVAVPDDLSMIAFHDAAIAGYLSPPLATVWMPLFELGEAATRLLVDIINGKSPASLQRVQSPEPRLIERKSLAPPRHERASAMPRATARRAKVRGATMG